MEYLLHVDPGLLIWTIVTFLLMVLVLWKGAWGPILKGLDLRAEKISGDLDRAEKARQDAEKTLADYHEQLAQARSEASSLMQDSKEKAESIKGQILKDAEKEALQIKERAKFDIEQAKKSAIQDVHQYASGLIIDVSKKILGEITVKDDHRKLIDQAVASYASSLDQNKQISH